VTTHPHPDDCLTFGCDACMEQVRADQRRAELHELTDAQLYDRWTSDPLGPHDYEVGLILYERSVISFEEWDALSDLTGEIA